MGVRTDPGEGSTRAVGTTEKEGTKSVASVTSAPHQGDPSSARAGTLFHSRCVSGAGKGAQRGVGPYKSSCERMALAASEGSALRFAPPRASAFRGRGHGPTAGSRPPNGCPVRDRAPDPGRLGRLPARGTRIPEGGRRDGQARRWAPGPRAAAPWRTGSAASERDGPAAAPAQDEAQSPERLGSRFSLGSGLHLFLLLGFRRPPRTLNPTSPPWLGRWTPES